MNLNGTLKEAPQWTTGSRLLRLGETISFAFYLPIGAAGDDLEIFPKYLERARPGKAFTAGGDLTWLDALPCETHTLDFVDGMAAFTYAPKKTGNFMARWRAGGESLHRYFAVIEDDWIVLSFRPFNDLEPEPTLHGTGIPMTYRLPVERQAIPEDRLRTEYPPEAAFDLTSALFQRLLNYHRRYGDAVVPKLPVVSRGELSDAERVCLYRGELEKARTLLPDVNDARSAYVEEDGYSDLLAYTEVFKELGVNDHCGLTEANAMPWLGMPEFPYFTSPVDSRKVDQGDDGTVVGHQFDFCGGWHFLGPASWHYRASKGQWDLAQACMERGLDEAANLTQLSGHPAFLHPLYDGVQGKCDGSPAADRFLVKYQRVMAFEFTRDYKLAFARTLDMADYFLRHFKVTPRTVFVSKTDHLFYDTSWQPLTDGFCRTRQTIPWDTNISAIMANRRVVREDRDDPMLSYFKDPLSCEFIVLEDQKRSIRFERECPNPVWWFDYADQDPERPLSRHGCSMTHTETPDVHVVRTQEKSPEGDVTISLRMMTQEAFPDYAVALWGLPVVCRIHESDVRTDAKEFVLARNTDGETHIVLFFDLKPNVEIHVTLNVGGVPTDVTCT